ncbi:MAG: response regulator [Gallionellaceae bacterium]
MKIQARILFLTASMIAIAVLVALLVSTFLTRDALLVDAKSKLSAVLEARHSALSRQLDEIHRRLHVAAEAPATGKSLRQLTQGFAKLGKNAKTLLQGNYLGGNAASKVMSASPYGRALADTKELFSHHEDEYEWYDLFLIDPHGNVVFSSALENDFATNLVTGLWKDTGLARAVVPLLHDPVPELLSFSDYMRYAPSANALASFLALPVFDHQTQRFLGVAAIQLPTTPFNKLVEDITGLGKSGETFLIGKGGWMLTDSRFMRWMGGEPVQLKAQAISRVLNGESGVGLYPDYRNLDVLVAFKPLSPFRAEAPLGDHPHWGVIAKIDKEEVFASYYDLREKLLWTGAALLLLSIAIGVLGARSITRPLFGIRDALTRLSRGELVDVPNLERSDEIGEMAQAAEAFRGMAQQVTHDHWIAENVTDLIGVVSVETSLKKAAESVLHLLCEKLDVPVGAIYLLNNAAYVRIGAHGLGSRSLAEGCFKLGEGLVGQCAKDDRRCVLSPVPSDLFVIAAGLTEFSPHELVLYPIAHKGDVLAVLELASTTSLLPMQHEFLQTASAALGLHLANLQASEHNLELLLETRRKSFELKEQQEELVKNNEELHAFSEELRSQTEEMKTQNEELRTNQEEMLAQQEEMQHKNLTLETQSTQLELVLEEAKNKAEDLARANQYKSEFLANMSHELRTPLNSVLILSRNLAENDENNLLPDQIESAQVISESGTQLLTLINDILDLSKIEAGKLELVKESFRLKDFLIYLRRLFSPQAEKKHLAFAFDVDSSVPEMIRSDQQRLTQVLSNLLSNAIKFTDSGEVKLSVRKDHEALLFDVQDSGIGIPDDKLEHIFGVFHQVDGSTSRKYGGSGLGLAISMHLSELLGGTIEVVSQPSEGSCFTVRLAKQFAAQPESELKKADGKKLLEVSEPLVAAKVRGSILIVEDDARLLAILGRMIQTLGFTPLCVVSAELALAEIEKAVPIGILLDLGLPNMSGMELLNRLKTNNATVRIPVYIMSGASDNGEAKVLGALGFLKKPVTRDSIAAALKGVIKAGPAQDVKRILLVDGNQADVEYMQTLFERDAVELVPVATGSVALNSLQTRHFDTVILDLDLPDMTGLEWMKQARHLLNPPPVVVYSSSELSEQDVFDLKEIAESIVNKGASNDRLREEVLLAAHLDSRTGEFSQVEVTPVPGRKLLIVDDDARNLFALTKALRAKGFVVEVAADGAKALELLSQDHFSAVLTDIMMPDMDGYALIREIRALGYSDMPIIAVTAKAMQGDDVLCIQAGANAYLSKPVDMGALLKLLNKD